MSKVRAGAATRRSKSDPDMARDCCQQIVIWMVPTERLRSREDRAVLISADLWKRIYLAAKKGAK